MTILGFPFCGRGFSDPADGAYSLLGTNAVRSRLDAWNANQPPTHMGELFFLHRGRQVVTPARDLHPQQLLRGRPEGPGPPSGAFKSSAAARPKW
jgi:hypothetical protein